MLKAVTCLISAVQSKKREYNCQFKRYGLNCFPTHYKHPL